MPFQNGNLFSKLDLLAWMRYQLILVSRFCFYLASILLDTSRSKLPLTFFSKDKLAEGELLDRYVSVEICN